MGAFEFYAPQKGFTSNIIPNTVYIDDSINFFPCNYTINSFKYHDYMLWTSINITVINAPILFVDADKWREISLPVMKYSETRRSFFDERVLKVLIRESEKNKYTDLLESGSLSMGCPHAARYTTNDYVSVPLVPTEFLLERGRWVRNWDTMAVSLTSSFDLGAG